VRRRRRADCRSRRRGCYRGRGGDEGLCGGGVSERNCSEGRT